jgi:uncharacterized membrane protein
MNRSELIMLAGIGGLGIAARLMLIDRSIEYDEAYTVMAFAHAPLPVLISDYHVPNNHVLHTLLVKLATLALGNEPWQVRMPVFLAGTLLIPFTFWLARTLYSRDVGYLAAAIVAFLPRMVVSSVSARGYILVTLLTVMAFLLACYLMRQRNSFAWCLLVVLAALGFYAVPIMLYPFGFLLLWMLMSTSDVDARKYTRSAWRGHLVAAGAAAALASLFLYSPILLGPGAREIVAQNRVLQSQSVQAFLAGLPQWTNDTIAEWTSYWGPGWSVIFLAGIVLSLVVPKEQRAYRVHTMFALVPAVALLLLVQRPLPVSRAWLWVIPFAAIWASAGLGVLLGFVRRSRHGERLSAGLVLLLVIALAGSGLMSTRRRVIANDVENPAAEAVAAFLAPHLEPDSLIVVSYNSDAYLWYYLYLEGVASPRIFNPNKDRAFDHVFAVVRTEAAGCDNPAVLDTLSDYGPDLGLLDLEQMAEVAQIDYMKICRVPARS